MNKLAIRKIFTIFEANNNAPTTELCYQNDFQLLVAVILSAQATDKGVNLATKKLFEIVKTPSDMTKLSLLEVEEFIKSIGLYHNKAKFILATAEILENRFAGKVPKTRSELMDLPGVGRKTANVILNTLWGEPVIAVDTHVYRVSRRLGLSVGATPLAVEEDLYKNIPQKFLKNAHHHLILLGRYICKATKPLCSSCPVVKLCEYENKRYSTN